MKNKVAPSHEPAEREAPGSAIYQIAIVAAAVLLVFSIALI